MRTWSLSLKAGRVFPDISSFFIHLSEKKLSVELQNLLCYNKLTEIVHAFS